MIKRSLLVLLMLINSKLLFGGAVTHVGEKAKTESREPHLLVTNGESTEKRFSLKDFKFDDDSFDGKLSQQDMKALIEAANKGDQIRISKVDLSDPVYSIDIFNNGRSLEGYTEKGRVYNIEAMTSPK